jgi:hypothetical protein
VPLFSLLQLLNSSTPQLLNSSTPQLLNSSTPQLLNSSTPQLLNSSTPQLDKSPSISRLSSAYDICLEVKMRCWWKPKSIQTKIFHRMTSSITTNIRFSYLTPIFIRLIYGPLQRLLKALRMVREKVMSQKYPGKCVQRISKTLGS